MSTVMYVSARILIAKFPNDRIRGFHTNVQLTLEKGVRFLGKGDDHFSQEEEKIKKAGEAVMKLIDRIYQLHGVKSVTIGDYEVSVTIAEAFEWDEVQPLIVESIINHFGVTADKVDIKQKYASGYFKSDTEPVGLDHPHPTPETFPEDDRDVY